jgi:hypothetical protein
MVAPNRIALLLALLLVFAGTAGAAGGKKPRRDTTPPKVTISSPLPGALLAGQVHVTGTATDNVQVAKVETSVDAGPYQAAQGTTAWAYDLDTTALSDGSHTVNVRATDTSGNAAVATVSVGVNNPVPDTSPPVVTISSPTPGAVVSGTLDTAGSASDNTQVAKVEVSVDGGAYQAAQGTSSWSYTLDTSGLAGGAHTLRARATDSSGNVATTSESVTVQSTSPPPGVAQQLVTPEGATIQIDADVSGWTTQQVYDLLKPNALELSRIGPSLTVRLQTQYASSTSASASESNGVYSNYKAQMYLQAAPGTVFTDRPEYIIAHEYGHVWTLYHLYMSQQGDWTKYLVARGIATDPRLDSTYNWSKNEMIADDYRMLFGTPAAVSGAFYINPDVPDPRTVDGLRDFFLNTWAQP